jgi:hypothetical protein
MGPIGDHEVTNMKAFDAQAFGFRNVPLDDIQGQWPQASTINPARIDAVGDSKRGALRKLANAESLNYSLRAFRAAVKNGDVKEFLENKEAASMLQEEFQAMIEMYDTACGPSVTSY